MMPVGRVDPATVVGSGPASRPESTATADAMPAQHALVPAAPSNPAVGASIRAADGRATAPFLAHLIATVQDAPQTRERRRADPNSAVTAYGAMMQIQASAGRAIRESR